MPGSSLEIVQGGVKEVSVQTGHKTGGEDTKQRCVGIQSNRGTGWGQGQVREVVVEYVYVVSERQGRETQEFRRLSVGIPRHSGTIHRGTRRQRMLPPQVKTQY